MVIDQLEECWTRSAGRRGATSSSTWSPASSTAVADVRVVATIRADVFDRPLQDTRLGPHVGAGAFVLAPMSPAQLGDAITLPAARAGVTVDDGVVADLVTEAASQPGSLPLLQFTLAELYDRRVDGRIGCRRADSPSAAWPASIGRRAEEVYAVARRAIPGRRPRAVRPARHARRRDPRRPPAGAADRAERRRPRRRRPLRRRPPARRRSRSGHPRAHRRGRPRGAADTLAAARRLDRRRPPVAHPAATPRRLGTRPGTRTGGRRPSCTAGSASRQRSRRSTRDGR